MSLFSLGFVAAIAGCAAAPAEPQRPKPAVTSAAGPSVAATDGGTRDGGPIQLPSGVRTQILTDVLRPPHSPTLPPDLNHGGKLFQGIFKICVTSEGIVSDVEVIKSADARLDSSWISTIRGWRYRPYIVDGRAVPFCRQSRIEVRAQED